MAEAVVEAVMEAVMEVEVMEAEAEAVFPTHDGCVGMMQWCGPSWQRVTIGSSLGQTPN